MSTFSIIKKRCCKFIQSSCTGFTIILPGAAPVVISTPGLFESTVTFDVKLFNSKEYSPEELET